ncbi:MAG: hypothetical protein WAW06_01915 [bacterium]
MASGKAQFRVGDTVKHKELGKGEILDVYPFGQETCAMISFEKYGQRKLILKYASLELVSRTKTEREAREERARPREAEVVEEVVEEAVVDGVAEDDEEAGKEAEEEDDES